MKTADVIREAMKKDLAAGEMEVILAAAGTEKRTGIPKQTRSMLIIAAAVCLLTVSVSAAAILSGFGTAFTVPLETGGVEVLDVQSTNEDVSWEITEVWFDEYNLYIGGNVTTPEPLDMEGEYKAICYVKEPGKAFSMMILDIFPNGMLSAPFVMQTTNTSKDNGNRGRIGVDGGETVLEVRFSLFHDKNKKPKVLSSDRPELLTYPGQWIYTIAFTQQMEEGIFVEKVYTADGADGAAMVVDTIWINAFTLKMTGNHMTYYRETSDGERETDYMVWLKMEDGSLLGKECGNFANTDNRFEHIDTDTNRILCCFDNPVDPAGIESILLVADWATFTDSAEDFLIREDWEYFKDPTDPTRLEGWKTIMEIPVN